MDLLNGGRGCHDCRRRRGAGHRRHERREPRLERPDALGLTVDKGPLLDHELAQLGQHRLDGRRLAGGRGCRLRRNP